MSRVYTRSFDWAEAAKRRAAGETLVSIANSYGVSPTAITHATNPERRLRSRERSRAWQAVGAEICSECGGARGRSRTAKSSLCWACSRKRLYARNAARASHADTQPDALRCHACGVFKPDDDFYPTRGAAYRRFRRTECRECDTKRRRAHRQAKTRDS